MNQTSDIQQEWLKVLGKGMVTLPKKWRDEMGISNGDIVKAKKEGNKVIIEGLRKKTAPYRIYSKVEITEFLKEDKLPGQFAKKVKLIISITLVAIFPLGIVTVLLWQAYTNPFF